MAHESFENSETARLLNEHFVSIKVDREERPDVDRLYMTFVQAMTGQGGWPMSVWLTPDLKPFVGGTYFPPVDKFDRPGFASILQKIHEAWAAQRDEVIAQSDKVLDAMSENTHELPFEQQIPGSPDASLLHRGYQAFAHLFDSEEGGWGGAPKFPRPTVFSFLFREYYRRGAHTTEGRQASEMALFTLRKMATGGINDHLGGGFHRYSVDEFWHVPHFEKMLYDQAQLAISYTEAFQITREPGYGEIAASILDYVRRDLTDALGGFYSAEDADSLLEAGKPEHAEGAFYIWTRSQIVAVLGVQDAALFAYTYGVEENGNASEASDPQKEFTGKNILIQRHSFADVGVKFQLTADAVAQRLRECREKLLAARNQRPRPHLDDKIITAWNGLAISAFARAYQAFGKPEYLEAARKAAQFIREQLTTPGGELLRSYRKGPGTVTGFADDYTFLIQALLDLYESDFDARWLDWAVALQEKMDALFWDEKFGGYFTSSGNDSSLVLRLKEDYDGAEPSPNSIAPMNLLRLSEMTGRKAWREKAERLFRTFHTQLHEAPIAVPQMMASLDYSLSKPSQIVFAANADEAGLAPFLKEVRSRFLPRKIVMLARDTQVLQNAARIDDKPTAYLCADFVCQAPTNDPTQFGKQLK